MTRSAAPVAVVTGGNRGLGLETCRTLARQGFSVILAARDLDAAERAAAGISGAGLVQPWQLDVTSQESVDTFARRAAEELKRIHVLVNNAGITQRASTRESSNARWP